MISIAQVYVGEKGCSRFYAAERLVQSAKFGLQQQNTSTSLRIRADSQLRTIVRVGGRAVSTVMSGSSTFKTSKVVKDRASADTNTLSEFISWPGN
jgi:hypothetical protein